MAATKAPVFAGDQHIIERPRLTRILDESKAKVILLLAPAGYGKTTLARQWLKDKPHVWYRASEADADVAALAVGIAVQASDLLPEVDKRIRQRVQAAKDPEREAGVLAEIVAEDFRKLPARTWIAIDDYHYIGSSAASELFVRLLVESVDSRFAVTSRTRPSWATPRSVIYGTTSAVGREALAMTQTEVTQVVGDASPEAARLFTEMMGWPAVIGLAARVGPERIEGQPVLGDLYDFFADELWRALTPEHQWQLAQLALFMPTPVLVAEDLFGDSASDLLASASSEGWIGREGFEIVIHPLLRRFLSSRFQTFASAQRSHALTGLIQALSHRQEWDQAMALALEWHEESVATVLARALEELLETGRLSTIARWLVAARERGMEAPILELAGAEVAFRRGDYIRAEALGRSAASNFTDAQFRARSLNRAGVSAMLLDHLDLSVALHREAKTCAPDSSTLREAVIGEIGASLDLGLDLEPLLAELPNEGTATDLVRAAGTRLLVGLHLGNLEGAVTASTVLMPALADVRDPLARTSFLHLRAAGLAMQAMYREALSTLRALDQEAATYGIDFARTPARLVRATAEAGLRNFATARRLIGDSIAEAQRDAALYWLTNALGVQARIEAGSGSGVVPPHRKELARVLPMGSYEEYVSALALAAASAGERRHAEALAATANCGFLTVDGRVLLAWVTAILSGKVGDAVSAFDLSFRTGIIDAFVLAYRARPQMIGSLSAQNEDYRRRVDVAVIRANDSRLLQEFTDRRPLGASGAYRLTPRETEVYALMVDGLSNQRIAQQLVITESTAKLHVRHILGKLCARSRAEAVAKWRDILGD